MRKVKIFLAMPLDEKFDNVESVIMSYGKNNNHEVFRADQKITTDNIQETILKEIAESDVVIADVTGSNENVFLELGYAIGFNKNYLLIAENIDTLPFDIRLLRVIPYHDRTKYSTIESALLGSIKETVSLSFQNSHLAQALLTLARTVTKSDDRNSLYSKLLETQIQRIIREVRQWTHGKMELTSQDMISKGVEVFENIKIGGFATFYAPIGDYWGDNDVYVNKSREIARDKSKQLSIERVYIVSSLESVTSENLLRNIEEDELARIKTYVVFKDEIVSEAVRDFGIWDETVVCIIKTQDNVIGNHHVIGGEFSRQEEDFEQYRGYKNEIKNKAISGKVFLNDYKNLLDYKKLLLKSVMKMEIASSSYCKKDGYLSKNNCSWYHKSWQYLRLLDLVSTPSWHGDFYLNQIAEYEGSENTTRILISGTADYGMLEQICRHQNANKFKEIVIIDACETPLRICDAFNSDNHDGDLQINWRKEDIRDTQSKDSSFDLIITDAFLTRFNNDERSKVTNEWDRILKINGKIVTTVRVENKAEKIIAGEENVNLFIRKAENKLSNSSIIIKYLKKRILESAKLYASNIISFPLKNQQEIKNLFPNYEINITENIVEGEINDETTYAQVIAKKISNKANQH